VGAGVSLVNIELDSSENTIKDAPNTLIVRDMLTKFGTINFQVVKW